jgi:fatty acid desaturase
MESAMGASRNTQPNRKPTTQTKPNNSSAGKLGVDHIDWRTLALAVTVLVTWVAALLSFRVLPLPIAILVLGVATAWHSSLQHELIHGHPFQNSRWNAALGWLPLGLWLPYGSYRDSHIRHHRNEILTDPVDDPESWYRSQASWLNESTFMRAVFWMNRTLVGRIVVGPWLSVLGYWRSELQHLTRGDNKRFRQWSIHVPLAAGVTAFAVGVCGLPLWAFLVGDIYVGTAFILVRSFAEHRWVPGTASKSAVVRAGFGWRMLFLNNNLHHAHHEQPSLAWYLLPEAADAMRAGEAAEAGAGFYDGYREVFRRYAFRPFGQPLHPAEGSLDAWRLSGTTPAQSPTQSA